MRNSLPTKVSLICSHLKIIRDHLDLILQQACCLLENLGFFPLPIHLIKNNIMSLTQSVSMIKDHRTEGQSPAASQDISIYASLKSFYFPCKYFQNVVLLWIKYLGQRISSFRGFALGLSTTNVQYENQCEASLICEVYLFQVDTQELENTLYKNALDILCDKLSPKTFIT